jgi:hypothetical protein
MFKSIIFKKCFLCTPILIVFNYFEKSHAVHHLEKTTQKGTQAHQRRLG